MNIRKLAEQRYNEFLKELEDSTIYNSDLEDETIKFYQVRPDVFIKTKREIIAEYKENKEKHIQEIIKYDFCDIIEDTNQ